jgi:hypothetical protein
VSWNAVCPTVDAAMGVAKASLMCNEGPLRTALHRRLNPTRPPMRFSRTTRLQSDELQRPARTTKDDPAARALAWLDYVK